MKLDDARRSSEKLEGSSRYLQTFIHNEMHVRSPPNRHNHITNQHAYNHPLDMHWATRRV